MDSAAIVAQQTQAFLGLRSEQYFAAGQLMQGEDLGVAQRGRQGEQVLTFDLEQSILSAGKYLAITANQQYPHHWADHVGRWADMGQDTLRVQAIDAAIGSDPQVVRVVTDNAVDAGVAEWGQLRQRHALALVVQHETLHRACPQIIALAHQGVDGAELCVVQIGLEDAVADHADALIAGGQDMTVGRAHGSPYQFGDVLALQRVVAADTGPQAHHPAVGTGQPQVAIAVEQGACGVRELRCQQDLLDDLAALQAQQARGLDQPLIVVLALGQAAVTWPAHARVGERQPLAAVEPVDAGGAGGPQLVVHHVERDQPLFGGCG